MQIDPRAVQWDEAPAIDVSAVQWDEQPRIIPDAPGDSPSELVTRFWQAKAQGNEKAASEIYRRVPKELLRETPAWYVEEMRQRNVDEMGPLEQGFAAAGGAINRLARGAGQVATQTAAALSPSPYAFPGAARDLAASQQAEAEQRALDAPLNRTGWGFSGNVATQAVPMVAGGVALRGTAAADYFLPRTFAGNIRQGVGLGALQPTTPGESRGMNMGLGGLAGGGGYGATRTVGGLGALMMGAPSRLSQVGVENAAGRTILDAAENPARLSQPAPSDFSGVRRSLAEESLDPGIAQLQRQYPQQMAAQFAENNKVRRQAIRDEFKGADESAIAAIEDARDAEARRALRGLRSNTSVAITPVVKAVDAMLTKQKGRPAVQSALAYVKQQLESGIETADQAYNVRKTIGDLMEGRLSGDMASASAAKSELMLIRGLLDRQMRQAVPQWGAYLRGYKSASREADQVRTGRYLLDKGATNSEHAVTDERNFTPDKVAALTNDRNKLVRDATGFRKASADRVLSPQQQQVISQLRDDLKRVKFANEEGRGLGSPTAQNGRTIQRAADMAFESLPLPGAAQRVIRGAVKGGSEGYQKWVDEQVAAMLSNPAKAREVIARLPLKDRLAVDRQLARLMGGAANSVVFPALQK